MIDYQTVSVFFRGAERLIVVLSGAFSIWMGWNLFKSKIVDKGDGSVAVGNWKMELKQVGPGIFFAAFGAVILYGSWATPLKFPGKSPPDPPALEAPAPPAGGGNAAEWGAPGGGFVFMSSQEKQDGKIFSLAVNELVHFSDQYCKDQGEDRPDCQPRFIAGMIKAFRDRVVIPKAFSEEVLKEARAVGSQAMDDPGLPEEVREYLEWTNKRLDQ